MSFLGLGKSRVHPTPTIGLPVSREVTVTAHVWPSERSSCKDLRIAFHSQYPVALESDIVYRILKVYGEGAEVNQATGNIKAFIPNPLIPLIAQKFEELGLNVKWLTLKL